MNVCMYTYVYVYVYVCMRVCMCVCLYIYIYIYIHITFDGHCSGLGSLKTWGFGVRGVLQGPICNLSLSLYIYI